MTPFKRFLRKVLNAIFPTSCSACGSPLSDDPNPFFCNQCWKTITPLAAPQCPRCSYPFPSPHALKNSPSHFCGTCRKRPPAFTKAWTPFPYKPPLKEAIWQFKYHGKINLAGPLADLMAAALHPLPPIDWIVPVPLHPNRLRDREYNQSLLLADRLSTQLHIPVKTGLLCRIRETPPQTTLRRTARLTNLRGSFSLSNTPGIQGQSILLVDDVFTTGTTVNECAKMLRKGGAGQVYVSTLARMI